MPRKVKLGVFKLASCDGCQLSLLDLEDDLLALADTVEIAVFLEASRRTRPGPYDVALVEGSVTTPQDVHRIRRIRAQSRYLVAIGACATAGGIQALRNLGDVRHLARLVYPNPEYLSVLSTATPLSAHVRVDLEIRGCPVAKEELLEAVTSLVHGRRPRLATHNVCQECKRRGNPCLLVTEGALCQGPITVGGCGALCPSYGRGCYGCFGPLEGTNVQSLAAEWRRRGHDDGAIERALHGFNTASPVWDRLPGGEEASTWPTRHA
jgi:sulfhydrogenase subunit delta